jgi:uncharacterized protein with PQ loop repeat
MKKAFVRAFQAILLVDGIIAATPQICRILRHRSSMDVSLMAWGWMLLMACSWAWQGNRDKSPMIFWGSVVWALSDAAVLVTAAIFRT